MASSSSMRTFINREERQQQGTDHRDPAQNLSIAEQPEQCCPRERAHQPGDAFDFESMRFDLPDEAVLGPSPKVGRMRVIQPCAVGREQQPAIRAQHAPTLPEIPREIPHVLEYLERDDHSGTTSATAMGSPGVIRTAPPCRCRNRRSGRHALRTAAGTACRRSLCQRPHRQRRDAASSRARARSGGAVGSGGVADDPTTSDSHACVLASVGASLTALGESPRGRLDARNARLDSLAGHGASPRRRVRWKRHESRFRGDWRRSVPYNLPRYGDSGSSSPVHFSSLSSSSQSFAPRYCASTIPPKRTFPEKSSHASLTCSSLDSAIWSLMMSGPPPVTRSTSCSSPRR